MKIEKIPIGSESQTLSQNGTKADVHSRSPQPNIRIPLLRRNNLILGRSIVRRPGERFLHVSDRGDEILWSVREAAGRKADHCGGGTGATRAEPMDRLAQGQLTTVIGPLPNGAGGTRQPTITGGCADRCDCTQSSSRCTCAAVARLPESRMSMSKSQNGSKLGVMWSQLRSLGIVQSSLLTPSAS